MIAKMRGEVTRAKNDIRRWNGSGGWVEALDGPVWFFGIPADDAVRKARRAVRGGPV